MPHSLQFLVLSVLAIVVGFWTANSIQFTMTEEISIYLAMGLIVTVDLLIEGANHYLEGHFNWKTITFNYAISLLLAALFLKMGQLMRVDLYIALFIVFGVKLFSNLSYISQKFFSNQRL
ncbi:MAG: small basic family protein [Cyanobacteria bacterium]|nr:small basic family protein [Cyanobacteriota bacterium]